VESPNPAKATEVYTCPGKTGKRRRKRLGGGALFLTGTLVATAAAAVYAAGLQGLA
jgi:hypothetical protein